MGSVIQFNRDRSNNAATPPIAGPQADGAAPSPGAASPSNRGAASSPLSARDYRGAATRNHEDESWKSLLILVVVFTATAIAMSLSVVLAGSNSWAEATPLIVFVVVFALTKVFLANALFYVMLRSDAHSEVSAAAAAEQNKAKGLVVRRPRKPPGFSRPQPHGARPRNGASANYVRLTLLTRKTPTPPPRPPHR